LLFLLKRGSHASKKWDTAQGYLKCVPSHIGYPVVRRDGHTDVRTDGHVTITSLPKFLASIGYHFSLSMVLRGRGEPLSIVMDLKKNQSLWIAGLQMKKGRKFYHYLILTQFGRLHRADNFISL